MTPPASWSVALVLAVIALAGCGPAGGESADVGSSSAPPGVRSSAAGAGVPSAPAETSAARPGAIPPLADGPTGPAHAAPRPSGSSSAPTRVRIPSIGVDSSLQRLGLLSDGSLETPSQWQVAGWYAGGVRPGDRGPAVIAGHVDSVSGPAVFYKLTALRPGSPVFISRTDGSTVRFTVARTDQYPKKTFPTDAVYGPTPVSTLRLVTCSGDFDYQARSYVDNLVVTAYLA